jgi:hypothetical protein
MRTLNRKSILVAAQILICLCSFQFVRAQTAQDYIEAGAQDVEFHNYEKAIIDYSKAIAKAPLMAEGYYCRGYVKYILNQNKAAEDGKYTFYLNSSLKAFVKIHNINILDGDYQCESGSKMQNSLDNNYRPHLSLKMKTPQSVYKQKSPILANQG